MSALHNSTRLNCAPINEQIAGKTWTYRQARKSWATKISFVVMIEQESNCNAIFSLAGQVRELSKHKRNQSGVEWNREFPYFCYFALWLVKNLVTNSIKQSGAKPKPITSRSHALIFPRLAMVTCICCDFHWLVVLFTFDWQLWLLW